MHVLVHFGEYVGLYVSIYSYLCPCSHVFIFVSMLAYIHFVCPYWHVLPYSHTFICVHVGMYSYLCLYTHASKDLKYTHVCVYGVATISIYIYINIHIYI